MKILGYILIVIGLGGAGLAFFGSNKSGSQMKLLTLSLISTATGFTLRSPGPSATSGMPQATALAGDPPPAAGLPAEGTYQVPLTAEVRAVILKETARWMRAYKIAVAIAIGAGVLLGLIFYFTNSPREAFTFLLGMAMGLAAALAFTIGVAINSRRARRDLNETTYLRTTGPMRLDPIRGGYILKLVDDAFTVESKGVAPALKDLDWVSLDYSKHAHIVFEARNRSGESVYCIDGYHRPGV